MTTNHANAVHLLRDAGLRATPGRIALIELLMREPHPLAVQQIEKRIGTALNSVTLYRALDALQEAGIVMRVNFEHDHAHYELTAGRPHHHHAICRRCGHIEDIDIPHSSLKTVSAKDTKGFAAIERYSLEFFGLCTKCS